jgi:hypothetical protein
MQFSATLQGRSDRPGRELFFADAIRFAFRRFPGRHRKDLFENLFTDNFDRSS